MDWSRKESVVAERFIRILKDKIYEKMAANGSKSYLGYLNKLVDERNKTYHPSICKKAYLCWLFCFYWRI